MKGHQSIIDLENQIISISNNTVEKYNYPKKYLIDYVVESIINYNLSDLEKLSESDKFKFEYNCELYSVNNRCKNNNKQIRDKALDNMIEILEKNNIEYSVII